MPNEFSIQTLQNIKSQVKQKLVHKKIEKAIIAIAKRSNITAAAIKESELPDYDINENSEYIKIIENIHCTFKLLDSRNSETYYRLPNNKLQKSTPKLIKEKNESDLKEFKKHIKIIKVGLSSQKKRIEEYFLTNRTLSYSEFFKHYFENNFIKILSKDIIWNFNSDSFNANLLYFNNEFVDAENNKYNKELKKCKVTLWHPIFTDQSTTLKWRSFITRNKIHQPFKQAFREMYISTPEEQQLENCSNRYTGHILNKDHVSMLCKERGWSSSGIDSGGKVKYSLPESVYKVEFDMREIYLGQRSKNHGSAHVLTDKVRFYENKKQLPLGDIPPHLFSEAMRDIDLFIGVTSIGNDPDWATTENSEGLSYWLFYANGELTERSKVRADVLKKTIPQTKIASSCGFEGKYLTVQGQLRKYKIHMGSGNILMEPNDQFLYMADSAKRRKADKVFIPFEGDYTLTTILSKAMLLANDAKIKDPLLLKQINSE